MIHTGGRVLWLGVWRLVPVESHGIDYLLHELSVAVRCDFDIGVLVAPGGVLLPTDDFTLCRVVDDVCAWD